LTKSAPFAAHKLHIALSYARTQALSALNIEHMPFRWPAMKKMPIMRDRKDKDREGKVTLDTSVAWADRWAEIEGVENEHIRLAWMLRWHTGMRGRMLRNLTWADIDLTAGTMLLSTGLKKVKGKRLIAMSVRSLAMFKRLHEIKMDDCDWVFPSRRRVVASTESGVRSMRWTASRSRLRVIFGICGTRQHRTWTRAKW